MPEIEGEGISGIVGNTELEIRLRHFNIRLSYARDISFSRGRYKYFVENLYATGVSYYLMQSLKLNYDFRYNFSEYPEDTPIQMGNEINETTKRARTFWSHRIGFEYRIIENIGIGPYLDIWKRTSSYSDLATERLLIGVSLTYNF